MGRKRSVRYSRFDLDLTDPVTKARLMAEGNCVPPLLGNLWECAYVSAGLVTPSLVLARIRNAKNTNEPRIENESVGATEEIRKLMAAFLDRRGILIFHELHRLAIHGAFRDPCRPTPYELVIAIENSDVLRDEVQNHALLSLKAYTDGLDMECVQVANSVRAAIAEIKFKKARIAARDANKQQVLRLLNRLQDAGIEIRSVGQFMRHPEYLALRHTDSSSTVTRWLREEKKAFPSGRRADPQ